jgi:pentatricopeptide repeat protein
LPFAAASQSADDELIADGLTDEIIARVGRANPGGLTVLGHTSSREYKGRITPLRELQHAMDVAYVVEGRVQRTPRGLRAIASLVRAEDGARLWTLDDESHEDLWAFQDSVAARVARGIDGAVLLRGEVLRRSARSHEANLSYLRGRALLVKRDSSSLRAALRAFEQCVADEPTFAPAWASMAETRIILMDHGLVDPSENWPEVKVAVDRSITLDPDLAEGWHALATYLSLTGARDGEARKAWERALTLNPNLVVAHHWNAVALAGAGRNKEAEAAIRRAIALDPLAPVLRGTLGDILSSQGRNGEALREFQFVLDLRPDWPFGHIWMGQALSREGRWAEAVESLERGAIVADGAARAHLVVALARSGNPEKARSVLGLMKASNEPYVAPYYRALASFSLGDRDAALADLRLAIAERSPLARGIRNAEDWKGFETDPRFQRLVQLASTH